MAKRPTAEAVARVMHRELDRLRVPIPDGYPAPPRGFRKELTGAGHDALLLFLNGLPAADIIRLARHLADAFKHEYPADRGTQWSWDGSKNSRVALLCDQLVTSLIGFGDNPFGLIQAGYARHAEAAARRKPKANPELVREVLERRARGMTNEQIADELEVSESAVSKRLQRARGHARRSGR
jgi:hypothetical protein